MMVSGKRERPKTPAEAVVWKGVRYQRFCNNSPQNDVQILMCSCSISSCKHRTYYFSLVIMPSGQKHIFSKKKKKVFNYFTYGLPELGSIPKLTK